MTKKQGYKQETNYKIQTKNKLFEYCKIGY